VIDRTGPPETRPPEALVAQFLRSVGTGDLASVEAALRAHPGLVNAVGPHPFWGGRPQALHVAIEANRPAMVKLLLRSGADVDGANQGYLHWSPLLIAIYKRQGRTRRLLLHRGATIGLAEALALGDDPRVRRLLPPGLPLPSEVPNAGSWLMFARTPQAIDRLLALGAAVDQPDRWGNTPIEAMSRLGRRGRPLVRHLQARGVPAPPEVFARLNDRPTLARLIRATPSLVTRPAVLKGAVDFGHHRLVEWLLDQGADPNARAGDQARETALHSAAWNGDARMVELLLARGANPNLRDHQHDATPRAWAATAAQVTNNPACGAVARRLEQAGTEWRAEGSG
jgi:ankyrin repeat protein